LRVEFFKIFSKNFFRFFWSKIGWNGLLEVFQSSKSGRKGSKTEKTAAPFFGPGKKFFFLHFWVIRHLSHLDRGLSRWFFEPTFLPGCALKNFWSIFGFFGSKSVRLKVLNEKILQKT
jgi:hypothetical protein